MAIETHVRRAGRDAFVAYCTEPECRWASDATSEPLAQLAACRHQITHNGAST
jgi:hypothetical protein